MLFSACSIYKITKLSKDAVHGWRSVNCSVTGPKKESLVKSRWNYKKAIKAAKNDYKRIRAEKLHQVSLHSDIKKFWKLVKTDCKSDFVTDSIQVDSFVSAFKSNFVDTLDNNEAVRDFYSKFDNGKQTEVKFFQVDELEKAVFYVE